MKQLGFQPEVEVWTVWTRSGLSGHGLRCLEPGQKFRKFNSDHFPFFKNLYRTFGSRVSLPWLEIGSGRSGNGVRCLEPGQKFRIFNFLKTFNPTSGSRVSIFGQKNTSPIVKKSPMFCFCFTCSLWPREKVEAMSGASLASSFRWRSKSAWSLYPVNLTTICQIRS